LNDALREHLAGLLIWTDAHANFDAAVADIPARHRGTAPTGFPHSPWQLLEHIRLTQADILEFCVRPDYREKQWPGDYWPKTPVPPNAAAWDASIASYRRDVAQLRELIKSADLFAKVPAGNGQTFLREFLLVADHTAYHVGQLVAVRRMLGDWAAS
jgi:hypothetical protein